MGWLTIPAGAMLAFFLFGIEEIGVQIEEPFGILPLEVRQGTLHTQLLLDSLLWGNLYSMAHL
jgi:predicted membrane chloride channel (bestrophin family)